MANLNLLFNPRGIAIIGASVDINRSGGQVQRALVMNGYKGSIYPVNPKYKEIQGIRSYSSVLEVDGPCDVAIISLPASFVPNVIEECGRMQIQFAVVHSSGFREIGSLGKALELNMINNARLGNVRIIGPNCLGVINVNENLYAAFGSMIRPPLMKSGSVSMVCQSGGFGHSIALQCGAAGIGFRYLVASGNEADLNALDLIDYYLEDSGTKVVISYIEGLSDGRRLMELGRKAASLNKPLILWKGGRGEQGVRAVASHTASMTGRYDVYQTALKQSAIIEVEEFSELVDIVSIFLSNRLPTGRSFGVLGGSGGSAIVFADACDSYRLKIPVLSAHQQVAISNLIPITGSAINPIDFTSSFLIDLTIDNFSKSLELIAKDDCIDQILIILSTVQGQRALNGAKKLAHISKLTNKPIYVFSSLPREVIKESIEILEESGIIVFSSLRRIAHAVAMIIDYIDRVNSFPSKSKNLLIPINKPTAKGNHDNLNEIEVKEWLFKQGIPVASDLLIKFDQNVPGEINFPVALKVLSRDLSHKSDVGGVKLDICNNNDLIQSIKDMYSIVNINAPNAILEGVIVSSMVKNSLEIIIGVVNDEVFGPVVMLGFGGTLAELYKDVTYRIAPFNEEIAASMLEELNGKAIFYGFRDKPEYDVSSLITIVSRISEIAWNSRAWLGELDINPLFIKKKGEGSLVGDALMYSI